MLDVNGDGRQDLLGSVFQDEKGQTPPDVWSVFWLEWTGAKPTANDWIAHPIKRAYGTAYKEFWFGEKYDFVRFADVDRDGDLDIVANIEELRTPKSTKSKSILGIVWFENAEVLQVAHDDFSNGLDGGDGWKGAWDVSGNARVVPGRDGKGSRIELQGEASVTRLLEKPLEHGMLDFTWYAQGFEATDHLIVEVREVSSGSWINAQSMINGQDDDNIDHNETLSLARFGRVDGVRFRLNADAADDSAWVSDIVLRARTATKRYDLKPPLVQ
jgi:hypothetical protein